MAKKWDKEEFYDEIKNYPDSLRDDHVDAFFLSWDAILKAQERKLAYRKKLLVGVFVVLCGLCAAYSLTWLFLDGFVK